MRFRFLAIVAITCALFLSREPTVKGQTTSDGPPSSRHPVLKEYLVHGLRELHAAVQAEAGTRLLRGTTLVKNQFLPDYDFAAIENVPLPSRVIATSLVLGEDVELTTSLVLNDGTRPAPGSVIRSRDAVKLGLLRPNVVILPSSTKLDGKETMLSPEQGLKEIVALDRGQKALSASLDDSLYTFKKATIEEVKQLLAIHKQETVNEVSKLLSDANGTYQLGLRELRELTKSDGRVAQLELAVTKLQQKDAANYLEILAIDEFYDNQGRRYYDYQGRRYYYHRDCTSNRGWRIFRHYR